LVGIIRWRTKATELVVSAVRSEAMSQRTAKAAIWSVSGVAAGGLPFISTGGSNVSEDSKSVCESGL
jgi:hypothetical protein